MNSMCCYRMAGVVDARAGLLAVLLMFCALNTRAQSDSVKALRQPPKGTVAVSDPSLDFADSLIQGFTQYQSSTAWCGDSIAVGYTDTALPGLRRSQGLNGIDSFNGLSVSIDGGRTFDDVGALQPLPSPSFNVSRLTGNASLACSSSGKFYYASTSTGLNSTIVVAQTSGTVDNWGPPLPAVVSFGEALTSPWIAVDPTNPSRLFLTCSLSNRALEIASSGDGGNSWAAPIILDPGLASTSLSAASVVVSPEGKVYVAYLASVLSNGLPSFEIRFLTSSDHGQTFGSPQTIASFSPPGAATFHPAILAANVRGDSVPILAVDRSRGPSRGTLYLAWVQGNRQVPDAGSPTGQYTFGDVVIAKSTNSGGSFTLLGPVSPTPADLAGKGRDQFSPGMAVDNAGDIGICYYDRRNDPRNFAVDRYCSVSRNQGATWAEERVSSPNWLPFYWDTAEALDMFPFDPLIALYDTVASDWTLQKPEFFGAFQYVTDGNPDIVGRKFSFKK